MVQAIPDVPRATWADQNVGSWCVLRTWGGREFKVAEALDGLRVANCLPYTRVRRIYAKRKVTVNVPLFGGYVFAECRDDWDAYNLSEIKYVSEVMRVPDYKQARLASDIANVRAFAEMAVKANIQLDADQFSPGRPVQVVRGPFLGLRGEVITRRNSEIIQVSISLLGQCVTLDIDPLDVEAIEPLAPSRN